MSNAVFGKTMENVRNRVDIQLYMDEKLVEKQISKPQFLSSKIYSDSIAVKRERKCVKLNKPVYVGVAVFDLSKLHMYKFHYDFIKEKYGDNSKLLFTDTDSLIYHIKTDDIYKDFKENKELFDFSDYSLGGYRSKGKTNKKLFINSKMEQQEFQSLNFVD